MPLPPVLDQVLAEQQGIMQAKAFIDNEDEDEGEEIVQTFALQRSASRDHTNLQTVKSNLQMEPEPKLQQYFKSFASWPRHWPKIVKEKERFQQFVDTFHDGQHGQGLMHHLGEKLKSIAYVVICNEKIALRSRPTAATDCLTGEKLSTGQLVVIDNIIQHKSIKYLKLRDSGWAFDQKQTKEKGIVRCMAFAECVEVDVWWYRVVSREYVETRKAPCFFPKARSGYILCPGEVVVIALRCFVDGRSWLYLQDGRGWIFEDRPPSAPSMVYTQGHHTRETVMQECDASMENYVERNKLPADAVAKLAASGIEKGLWEYVALRHVLIIGGSTTGHILERGEKCYIDLRVPADGQKQAAIRASATASQSLATQLKAKPTVETRIWLRLDDGRGWVPKTHLDGSSQLSFLKIADCGTVPPVVNKDAVSLQSLLADAVFDWTQGVA
jgi:hypothetical protein